MTPEQAADILGRFVAEHQQRLATAARNQRVMHAAVARGEVPHGPRPSYIIGMAEDIVMFLRERAGEFNANVPYDYFTAEDCLDTLATARTMLVSGVVAHRLDAAGE